MAGIYEAGDLNYEHACEKKITLSRVSFNKQIELINTKRYELRMKNIYINIEELLVVY